MKKIAFCLIFSLFAQAEAGAATLLTKKNVFYEGAVSGLAEDTVYFLWEKKTKKEEGKEDLEGLTGMETSSLVELQFQIDSIQEINGMAPAKYLNWRKYNAFYYLYDKFDLMKVAVSTAKTWVKQVIAAGVFLAVYLLVIPLTIWLIAFIFRMKTSFTGSIGIAVLLSLFIFGLQIVGGMLVNVHEICGTAGFAISYAIITMSLIAILVHATSSYNILQGVLFLVAWIIAGFASMKILQNILIRLT
jgi:hypothetical protein